MAPIHNRKNKLPGAFVRFLRCLRVHTKRRFTWIMRKFRVPTKSFKPKFTPQQFVDGTRDFEVAVAEKFYQFVLFNFQRKNYDFTIIKENLGIVGITKESLQDGLTHEGSFVFIRDAKYLGEITYKELFSILEYGRKDKGVHPQPLLRKCFDDFYPLYKKEYRDFILGKR